MKETSMESEAMQDLAKLEPYFDELKSWPSSYILTAEMWPTFSQQLKDALEVDLMEVGYRPDQVWAVEYKGGKLHRVTVVVHRL